MAKSLKTAYLVALIILSIFFVFYFMNSSEGFYAKNNILTSTTQSSANNCFSYCNGDSSSGTYANYEWCDNGFVNTSGGITKSKCSTSTSCKCISKRT